MLRNLLAAARSRDSRELRNTCGVWLAALYFFNNEAWASEILSNAIDSIRDNLDELQGAKRLAIKELLPRTQKEPSPVEQRQRATDFLLRLLSAANQALEAYRVEITNLQPYQQPTEPPPWVKQIGRSFNTVASEFRVSAKEQANQWALAQHEGREVQMTAWWETVEPILNALLAMPHPGIVFHLIQGLGHLVSLDVQRTLHWLKRATLASVPLGLANEPLAADHTIGILERILAEHRASLASGGELRLDLVQVLEAYLQVGWPRAIRLAIQLESIFR